MKQVNILKIWLGITIFFSVPLQATTINPQIGDSVWEVIDRIGQNTDETSSTYTAVRSIETKTDALAVNFKETWTAIEALEGGIISIGATGGTYTINSSGKYKLVADRTNPIITNVDNVCLDLACFNIIVSSDVDGIKINSGKTRVKINNGRVVQTGSSTKSGILIESSASRIKIENVELENFNTGVKFNGESDLEVTNSEVAGCDFILNTTGIQMYYSDNNIIKNCTASENDQAGFELLDSECNCLFDCQALETKSASDEVVGFKSEDGSCNLFQRCVAKRTENTDTGYTDRAYGFLLTGTEENSKIIDCIANETNVSTSGDAVPKGIALVPIYSSLSDSLATVNLSALLPYTVAWSPNRKYIATGEFSGTTTDRLRIWTFDGSNLVNVATSSTENNISNIKWSPDGKYIAMTSNVSLKVFSFDGTNITQVGSTMAISAQGWSATWSPDGKYISCGSASGILYVAKFDGSTLSLVTSLSGLGSVVRTIDWSPDGKYIATGDNADNLSIFSFDGTLLTLIHALSAGAAVNSIEWESNGKYILTGGLTGNPGVNGEVHIWSFNGSTISYVTGVDVTSETIVWSVSWKPDGKVFIVGGNTNLLNTYNFDGTSINSPVSKSTSGAVYSVSWSPDGKYIASADTNKDVRVWGGINAPQNCLINNCRVCDTQANTGNLILGTGIDGGGQNSFADNVCCNNEVNFTFGIPNTYFGDQNTMRPFDNLSMPQTR